MKANGHDYMPRLVYTRRDARRMFWEGVAVGVILTAAGLGAALLVIGW